MSVPNTNGFGCCVMLVFLAFFALSLSCSASRSVTLWVGAFLFCGLVSFGVFVAFMRQLP